MTPDLTEYLTATQAVGYLASQGHRKLSPGTFTRYVRRGYGPAADARVGPQQTRVWLTSTLDQWAAQRPGQGRRRTTSEYGPSEDSEVDTGRTPTRGPAPGRGEDDR